jgi:hypothetical protein
MARYFRVKSQGRHAVVTKPKLMARRQFVWRPWRGCGGADSPGILARFPVMKIPELHGVPSERKKVRKRKTHAETCDTTRVSEASAMMTKHGRGCSRRATKLSRVGQHRNAGRSCWDSAVVLTGHFPSRSSWLGRFRGISERRSRGPRRKRDQKAPQSPSEQRWGAETRTAESNERPQGLLFQTGKSRRKGDGRRQVALWHRGKKL